MDIRLERRLSPRRNTLIHAEIVFNGGRSRVPCMVRNLSDTGAKLDVASVVKIPQTFDLVAPRSSPIACRVIWRALKELGVQFES